MNYRITIASRGRAGKVETIKNLKLDPDNVDIFVDTNQEEREYRKYYNNVYVTGTNGITNARNFILDHYPVNSKIIMMCDDVQAIGRLSSNKKSLQNITGNEVDKLICEAFIKCKQFGTKLWGVYPVYNSFFMNHTISSGFCIASFCGIIVSKLRYPSELKLKEDYAFTLDNILKYKKVLRCNYLSVKARHYKNKGGCQDYRNDELEKHACNYLLSKYPWGVRRHPKRENEVILSFKRVK
jgi:hypothetical protein